VLNLQKCPVEDIAALEGMPLRDLNLAEAKVRSIRPLKGMSLEALNLSGNQVDMITTLSGMPLKKLDLGTCPVLDIRPLRGAPLTMLSLWRTRITDLKVLKEMPLTWLNVGATQIASLQDLRGLRLETLTVSVTPVKDLTPLKDMPLKEFYADQCGQLSDLSPLEGKQLVGLHFGLTGVTDMRVLKGMPLRWLNITGLRSYDLEPLRGMTTLQHVQWDIWDQYRIMTGVRVALAERRYDDAARGASAMADLMEQVPAFAPTVVRLRTMVDRFIPLWAGSAGKPQDLRGAASVFEGHAYLPGPVVGSRDEALAFCKANGAHLAAITSKKESDWVTETFSMFGIPVLLGGTDERKEGSWRWVTDEPWEFANWGTDQPDNFQGRENSLALMTGGKWVDLPADAMGSFLMEWDK
jgi:hypothetical protein